jgi:hypothetical protein
MYWSNLVVWQRSGTAARHSQQQWRLLLQNLREYAYSPETRWKPAGRGFRAWEFCARCQQLYCEWKLTRHLTDWSDQKSSALLTSTRYPRAQQAQP